MVVMNLKMFSIPRYSEASRHWLRGSLQELLGCLINSINSIAQLCFHIDSIHSILAEVECSNSILFSLILSNDDKCVSINSATLSSKELEQQSDLLPEEDHQFPD